ncbi:MAG TPA: PAS domain S-box protein [Bryobacteraceae bacterium]|nr:PAS domain S-box protein [Bryobacteraceae bacterium]
MQRREAESEARTDVANTEGFFRHLIENSLGLMCCHDFNGVLLMVNSAAASALGYTPEELIGTRIVDFVPPELKPRFAKYMHRVVTFGQAHGYLTLMARSGETVVWVYRNAVYRSSSIVIGHAQDITWRLRMEKSLKESNEQFRALFEDAPVAYHELDGRGTVVRVNRAECELLGRPRHEILGRPVWELVVAEQRDVSRHDVEQKLSGKRTLLKVSREYELRDGGRVYVDIHDKLIRSASGDIVGIRSTLLDVTERYRIETELRALNADLDRRVHERTAQLTRSNERLKEFVYTVSHDLQEPLRAVMLFGELLRERYAKALDKNGLEFLEFMTSAASRMSGLIEDLLKYSRLLHETSPLMEPISLEGVLKTVEENLTSAMARTSAAITHDPLPVVTANENRVVQLFQNLLSNAIKYSGEKPPEIHVSAERRDDAWVISVTDTGVGISEADRDRIFGLFKRSGDRRQPGLGVGLAICRAIVQQHGGEIWVESNPGGGSRFRFSLPDP